MPRPAHLIVIDNRKDFALRVWRYLGRSIGIGFGPNDSVEEAPKNGAWLKEGTPVLFDDGTVCFWWLKADGQCLTETLPKLLDSFDKDDRIRVLVDVMGEDSYSAGAVCQKLLDSKGSRLKGLEWEVISSYPSPERIGGQFVQPKSVETLRKVRENLYPSSGKGDEVVAMGCRHILVTGAGFEIRDWHGGFGMPPTRELLAGMESPFFMKGGVVPSDETDSTVLEKPKDGKGFPYPVWADLPSMPLREAAREEQLDLYWDILLKREMAPELDVLEQLNSTDRAQVKARILLKERRRREAFRRSILEHDWGFMGHPIVAARLGWWSWLTTNYTRFVDRAIALAAPMDWRIISTASEANISLREDNWDAEEGGRKTRDRRYLFKLHGDIGHLHTMAIAGHDKDTFSPLSMPVDSLYQLYAGAEKFLGDSLREEETLPVVWHIVGHALGDRRLVKLIQRVSKQIKTPHLYLIADPAPTKPQKGLETVFGTLMNVETRTFYAGEYMARIERTGLPEASDVAACRQWFKDLPAGQIELLPKAV